MFNINLSFFKSSEFEGYKIDYLEHKSNDCYQNFIIDSMSLKTDPCDTCIENPELIEFLEKEVDSADSRNVIEAQCGGLLGDHFCLITDGTNIELLRGDLIVIKCEDTLEISRVKEVGGIVRFKRTRIGLSNENLPELVRKATEEDIDQLKQNQIDEYNARSVFRNCVDKYKLSMKLVGIHYQFDRKKLYFFYTSEGRVDFRELAKELASIFKTRIELRQIGVRDEAKKVGGLGTCGREYCCSLFLDNFKRITTQIANEQNITTNMSKLSGPCGKLKCCLSYEIE